MDIGVPYRKLAQLDIGPLKSALESLSNADWEARPIRRASLAAGAHNAAQSIVLRHEWKPQFSRHGYPTLQASLLAYCRMNGIDPEGMLPVLEERNAELWVYTFPAWRDWQPMIMPIILDIVGALEPKPTGILTRALFVRLAAGASVPVHIDEQPHAAKTHRIHLCISDAPRCEYTVGDTRFTMQPGVAYDFNNRWTHGVENRGDRPRINMMLEYLPQPDWWAPFPILHDPAKR